MSLFSYEDYVDFLREKVKANGTVRGYQAKMAHAAGVHGSYLSRVLAEQVHLTPDQAVSLADFFGMNADETDYFLTLVLKGRAGSPKLRAHLERRLGNMQKEQDNLAQRFRKAHSLSLASREIYYSAWYYGAIHVGLMVPRLQKTDALSTRLGIPIELLTHHLETLQSLGLIEKKGDRWVPLEVDIHLSNQEIWSSIYHASWRQRTSLKAQDRDSSALHFTGVYSVSGKDFSRIRDVVKDTLQKTREMAMNSNNEDIAVMNLDWYSY